MVLLVKLLKLQNSLLFNLTTLCNALWSESNSNLEIAMAYIVAKTYSFMV